MGVEETEEGVVVGELANPSLVDVFKRGTMERETSLIEMPTAEY